MLHDRMLAPRPDKAVQENLIPREGRVCLHYRIRLQNAEHHRAEGLPYLVDLGAEHPG